MRVIVYGAGLITLLASLGWRTAGQRPAEYVALLMIAAAGMSMLAVANTFMSLFVALELFSITLYLLCAFETRSRASLESGLKYLVLGSVGSAVLLYGMAFLYGATGSLRFDEVSVALGQGEYDGVLALIGSAMLLAGLCFKVAAVPFHMWTPDVYEGAPTPIAGFMSAATKAAAFTVLVRVLVEALPSQSDYWEPALAAIAIASMVLGNVAALTQRNVKRMLAYSSIGHAGYLLIAVISGGDLSTRALLFYLAVYSATSVGAFAVVAVRERETGEPVTLDTIKGWGFSRPLLGVLMAIFLLSLAGFPPTGGFLAKLYIFGGAVDTGDTYLAVVGVVDLGDRAGLLPAHRPGAVRPRRGVARHAAGGARARLGHARRGARGRRRGVARRVPGRRARLGARRGGHARRGRPGSLTHPRPLEVPMLADTRLTWYGHGTWGYVTPGGVRLLVDPWLSGNPACPEELYEPEADVILVTHGHGDHIADVPGGGEAHRAPRWSASTRSCCGWRSSRASRTSLGFNTGGRVEAQGHRLHDDQRRALRLHRVGRRDRRLRRRAGRLRHPPGERADGLPGRRHRGVRRHGADRGDLPARPGRAADRRPVHHGPAAGGPRGAAARRPGGRRRALGHVPRRCPARPPGCARSSASSASAT